MPLSAIIFAETSAPLTEIGTLEYFLKRLLSMVCTSMLKPITTIINIQARFIAVVVYSSSIASQRASRVRRSFLVGRPLPLSRFTKKVSVGA